MLLFPKALEPALRTGIVGGRIWRSGPKVKGLMKDFFGKDSGRGWLRMGFGENGMGEMLRWSIHSAKQQKST